MYINNYIYCFRLIIRQYGWLDIYHKIVKYLLLVVEEEIFAYGNSNYKFHIYFYL